MHIRFASLMPLTRVVDARTGLITPTMAYSMQDLGAEQ